MSSPSQPTSSKRRRPFSGDVAIQFRPGTPGDDLIFETVEEVTAFIRAQTDSDVTVYINLNFVGGTYALPTMLPPDPLTGSTAYNFNRVYLDGFFNADGSIPVLVWTEGARVDSACNFIRKRDVDFKIENVTTTVWRPTSSARIEDEKAGGF